MSWHIPVSKRSYLSKLGSQLHVKLCPSCGFILEYYVEFDIRVIHNDLFVCVNPDCGAFEKVLFS